MEGAAGGELLVGYSGTAFSFECFSGIIIASLWSKGYYFTVSILLYLLDTVLDKLIREMLLLLFHL